MKNELENMMKNKWIVTLLGAVTLLAAGSVYAAEENNDINNQNLSRRPYQPMPDEAAYNKKQHFEGATLIEENVEAEKTHKKMLINNLGRRPYMEKTVD